MTIDINQIREDFNSVISDTGSTTITIGSTVYPGLRHLLGVGTVYVPGGARSTYQFSVSINSDQMNTPPAIREIATISGIEYRILNIHTDSLNLRHILALGHKRGVRQA